MRAYELTFPKLILPNGADSLRLRGDGDVEIYFTPANDNYFVAVEQIKLLVLAFHLAVRQAGLNIGVFMGKQQMTLAEQAALMWPILALAARNQQILSYAAVEGFTHGTPWHPRPAKSRTASPLFCSYRMP
jgi:hypothetical protein